MMASSAVFTNNDDGLYLFRLLLKLSYLWNIMFIMVTLIIFNTATAFDDSQCICNVRFVGEYCGITLNERNSGGNCSNDMYFCGKSNLQKEGVKLKTCVQHGFECDKKLNGGW